MVAPTVSFNSTVRLSRLADLLCNALEGGSNYWYTIEKFNKPESFELYCTEKLNESDKQEIFKHLDYPVNPGGSIVVSDRKIVENEVGGDITSTLIDKSRLTAGLELMSKLYPRHFANFMNEDDDAETGDVFLQCCVFGKLVYG